MPAYRFHVSGQAVVTLAGKDFYLGPHDSPESRARYFELVQEYNANGKIAPNTPAPELKSLLRPFADEPMQEHYVTRRMSNPRYEAPDCNTAVDLS